MKSELKPRLLQNLVSAYPASLKPNPEYQRGLTWTIPQRQGLIDSILRGYQLPIFYVHLDQDIDLFTQSVQTKAWIVDGQQRLAAIVDFCGNKFQLADPAKAKSGTVIPIDPSRIPSWSGKKFQDLSLDDRDRILNHELLVIEVTAEKNEVRELFIRLQGGTPLSAQEKRDAWPGDFTNFVIRCAGKPGHHLSSPLSFFDQFKKTNPKRISVADGEHYVDGWADRRKFFAGLAMTLMLREKSDVDFVDIKGKTINDFYIENLELPNGNSGSERVIALLDVVSNLPNFEALKQGSPMTFQMAFHFTLMVDSLDRGNYTSRWKQEIVGAFLDFKKAVADARIHHRETRESLPHYERFGRQLSGSGSDTAESIRLRHSFMLGEIYPNITTIVRDHNRGFDLLEREVIWNRDRGRCQSPGCSLPDKRVSFGNAVIHHVVEYSEGGRTKLKNGVLVCELCHRNRSEMQNLTGYFQDYLERIYSKNTVGVNDPLCGELEIGDQDDSCAKKEGLRVTINWGELNVDRPSQSIRRKTDAETIVEMLQALVSEFGEKLEEQLKSVPIIRYPLSADPKTDFLNRSTGKPYSYLVIREPDLYFCPQSSRSQKLERLRSLFSQLRLPSGDDFPEDGVLIALDTE